MSDKKPEGGIGWSPDYKSERKGPFSDKSLVLTEATVLADLRARLSEALAWGERMREALVLAEEALDIHARHMRMSGDPDEGDEYALKEARFALKSTAPDGALKELTERVRKEALEEAAEVVWDRRLDDEAIEFVPGLTPLGLCDVIRSLAARALSGNKEPHLVECVCGHIRAMHTGCGAGHHEGSPHDECCDGESPTHPCSCREFKPASTLRRYSHHRR